MKEIYQMGFDHCTSWSSNCLPGYNASTASTSWKVTEIGGQFLPKCGTQSDDPKIHFRHHFSKLEWQKGKAFVKIEYLRSTYQDLQIKRKNEKCSNLEQKTQSKTLRWHWNQISISNFVHENKNVVEEKISIGNIEKSKIATELAGPDSLSSC